MFYHIVLVISRGGVTRPPLTYAAGAHVYIFMQQSKSAVYTIGIFQLYSQIYCSESLP